MAQNYVEILVKARDQAAPELDALRARLDELKHTVAEARATVDDADAAAKLDRLDAQLIMIGKRTASPKIDLAGAIKAEAQIHAVEASLDNLKRKADESGSKGLLGKLLFGDGGKDSNGLLGSFGSLPGGAGLGELFTNPYGIAAIGAGIAALLPELAGLLSGFSAAGAGAGAFYLLAHPAISNLTQDTQGLLAAEQALQLAQNKYAVDPTKANAKALQSASDNLKAVQLSMSQDAGGAAGGIVKLRTEYEKLTTAFQPDVFKVFNAGLKLANTLLPDVMPFAQTFAGVMTTLLGQADKFAGSKGFADWLKQFHGLEGPALDAIGKGFGQVAIQLGKLLTIMSAKDVVNSINIAFSVLSGTIDGLRHVVEAIMRAWDVTSKTMARDARQVATAFDALRHDLAVFGDDVLHIIDQVVAWWTSLPRRMMAAANWRTVLYAAGQSVVEGFINGIGSMFGAVAAAGLHMVESLGSKVLHVLGIGSPSKVAHWWGQMVAQGLAEGMMSGAGTVASAAGQMAGGIGSGLGSATVSGGGGGVLRIEVTGGGSGLDQVFMTWLKNNVRASGGDPGIFTRKVKFA